MKQEGSLGLIITYLCNIQCRHCCFGCGPLKRHAEEFLVSIGEEPGALSNGQSLEAEEVTEYIDTAVRLGSFHEVVFSGGEPMLFPDVLEAGLRAATRKALNTRIVTNGTWARSLSAGSRILARLRQAGLQEITLSHTDFHREFVPFETLLQACRLARAVGLRRAISVTTNDDSQVTAASLREELAQHGEDPSSIRFFENDAIDTGRGKDLNLPSHEASRGLSEGGCYAAGTQPIITPDRKVFACCGPPHRELDLLKMGDLSKEPLAVIFQRMQASPVLHALFHEGPGAIHRKFDPSVEGRRMHICQHCKHVLIDHRERFLDYVQGGSSG